MYSSENPSRLSFYHFAASTSISNTLESIDTKENRQSDETGPIPLLVRHAQPAHKQVEAQDNQPEQVKQRIIIQEKVLCRENAWSSAWSLKPSRRRANKREYLQPQAAFFRQSLLVFDSISIAIQQWNSDSLMYLRSALHPPVGTPYFSRKAKA
ncbi:MAG: hypothetical protein ACOC2L_01335, partial [Candidatus Sumerlaeota bacterium]